MKNRKQVILIGGSPDYLCSVGEALRLTHDNSQLIMFCRGVELLAWLDSHPRPSLILLDNTVVDSDGVSVLTYLKQQDAYRAIPIIVLSTSMGLEDVRRSYNQGANAYIVKPTRFQDLQNYMALMTHYWFNVAQTPKEMRELA